MQDHLKGQESEVILPQMAIEMLFELTKGEAISRPASASTRCGPASTIVTNSRASCSPAPASAQWAMATRRAWRQVACPDKQVIDIDGDGSFLMNVQELATAHIEKIAAKAFILNNQHLGMVVQWEDKFYEGNRGHTYLGDPGIESRFIRTTSRSRRASTSRASA